MKDGSRTIPELRELLTCAGAPQKPGQAATPLPLTETASSSQCNTKPLERKRKLMAFISDEDPEAIKQMYRGVKEPGQAASVEEIHDSTSEAAPPSVSPEAEPTSEPECWGQDVMAWWSMEENCLVRMHEEGQLERASMQKGKRGFAIAVWADGTKVQTDKTNLLVFETPKMVAATAKTTPRKKPAAAAKSQSLKKTCSCCRMLGRSRIA